MTANRKKAHIIRHMKPSIYDYKAEYQIQFIVHSYTKRNLTIHNYMTRCVGK